MRPIGHEGGGGIAQRGRSLIYEGKGKGQILI